MIFILTSPPHFVFPCCRRMKVSGRLPEHVRGREKTQPLLRVSLSQEDWEEVRHVPLLDGRGKVSHKALLRGTQLSEDSCCQEAEFRGPLLRLQDHGLQELQHRATQTVARE